MLHLNTRSHNSFVISEVSGFHVHFFEAWSKTTFSFIFVWIFYQNIRLMYEKRVWPESNPMSNKLVFDSKMWFGPKIAGKDQKSPNNNVCDCTNSIHLYLYSMLQMELFLGPLQKHRARPTEQATVAGKNLPFKRNKPWAGPGEYGGTLLLMAGWVFLGRLL